MCIMTKAANANTKRLEVKPSGSQRTFELLLLNPEMSVYDVQEQIKSEGFPTRSIAAITVNRSSLRAVLKAISVNIDKVGLSLDERWLQRHLSWSRHTRMSPQKRAQLKNAHKEQNDA